VSFDLIESFLWPWWNTGVSNGYPLRFNTSASTTYSMQFYVTIFVSDFRMVDWLLSVLHFHLPFNWQRIYTYNQRFLLLNLFWKKNTQKKHKKTSAFWSIQRRCGKWTRGRRGRNRIVVEFITTYAISAYHP
jgi:hypothetical protein